MKKRTMRSVCVLLAAIMISAIIPGAVSAQGVLSEAYSAKRHLRGAWICTVINMDWPTAQTSKLVNDAERIQKSREELIVILDRAVEMKLNAVFFQVSPEADAFYKSNIVPWSRYLTGTFGKDPGFDPLAFAIEEARKRNLEIHAWFNPYRVSMNTSDATKASLSIEKSVYKDNPAWVKTSMNRFVVDPGIPEARQWVINRVMEVVNNYDIDGIHFDDYFYYEQTQGELQDQETFNKYNKGQFSNLGDWRRNNTYLLVKELSAKIRAAKQWVKFGISPSGVWGNKKDHPDGSNTNTTYTNYERCFADTKKWVKEELLDYIAPQIYFSFANARAPYGELANWWSNLCKGKKVQLYIGQALYKINDDSDSSFLGANALPEFSRQLEYNISKPEIAGTIMFRMKSFTDTNKQEVVAAMKNKLWPTIALVPVMPWKGGKAPAVPQQPKLEAASDGLRLSWADSDPTTAYFAIYRFNRGEALDINSNSSASRLIATVRKTANGRQQFVDNGASNISTALYVVTALDRLHNESGGLTVSINQSDYFSDVGEPHFWAVKAIDSLYSKGIVKGDDKGRFNPSANTKRGDFILMVVRALNLSADFKENFKDVSPGSYYYDAIGIARALGVAKGSGDSFNPNGNITRQDMMVILARALEASGKKLETAGDEALKAYSDEKSISSYAREAAASLSKAGLIQGSGGKINPKSLATRAELAVILNRVLENIIDPLSKDALSFLRKKEFS
ncbi:MAG: family 10 glycosylhydrolase [Clostridia bacterium]|nr:family 10 glycosylhydrolase [Clostridia bacterium]